MQSKLKALEEIVNAVTLDDGVQKYVLFAAAKGVSDEMVSDLDAIDASKPDDVFATSYPREKLVSVMSNLSYAVMPDEDTDTALALNNSRHYVNSLKRHFDPFGA